MAHTFELNQSDWVLTETNTIFSRVKSEKVKMKQAKLSFLRSSKRKAEANDPEPKSKRAKEAIPVPKRPEPEPRETSKKKNVVQQLELMNNNKNETRFSDSMKDAVKTLCKICEYVRS